MGDKKVTENRSTEQKNHRSHREAIIESEDHEFSEELSDGGERDEFIQRLTNRTNRKE